MAEALGVGLAFASLSFQVFSGCVKGYQLLCEAKNMPKELQYLRVQIKTEQCRLLNWADVVRLDESDEEMLIARTNKNTIVECLEQQRVLLLSFGRLDERYKPLPAPLLTDAVDSDHLITELGEDEDEDDPRQYTRRVDSAFDSRFPGSDKLLKKALRFVQATQKLPTRLRWASIDKAKLEILVGKLTSLNNFLQTFLTNQQMDELLARQTRTEYQIVQMNRTLTELVDLVKSGAGPSILQANGPTSGLDPFQNMQFLLQGMIDNRLAQILNTSSNQRIAALAQSKALITAVEHNSLSDSVIEQLSFNHSATEIKDVELDRRNVQILDQEELDQGAEGHRYEALYTIRVNGIPRKTPVWVEWKNYDPIAFNAGPDPKIVERFEELTMLLKEEQLTSQFRAPRCLGYFHDHIEKCRFGLVFEKPGSAGLARPVSLLDIITDPERYEPPSLTQRANLAHTLAEIVEKLHAVDWLHKGIRSHSIIFFPSTNGPDTQLDLSNPYITGFDYSRPAQADHLTEKLPEHPAYDLYRHPTVQGASQVSKLKDPRANFYKKSYDIYSLGIVMLELAFWKPVQQILGLDESKQLRPATTYRVRETLLSPSCRVLGDVRRERGEKLGDAVRACVEGPRAFGMSEGEDEREPVVGQRLQVAFYEKVVRVLGEIKL